jgi:hypothetical protein
LEILGNLEFDKISFFHLVARKINFPANVYPKLEFLLIVGFEMSYHQFEI